MTGYTRFWNCRICGDRQESIDNPMVEVCDKCIRPLANRLCREKLNVDIGPGVDESFFTGRAYEYAHVLFRRGARGKKTCAAPVVDSDPRYPHLTGRERQEAIRESNQRAGGDLYGG